MQAAVDLDARGRRLRGALAAVLVRDRVRELDLVHQWLSTCFSSLRATRTRTPTGRRTPP